MKASSKSFDERAVLHELKRYLPSQAPLKDYIFQNPLQAFQNLPFEEGLRQASALFGYRTLLPLEAYRHFYNERKIASDILEKVLLEKKGAALASQWRDKILLKKYDQQSEPRIGQLRSYWKQNYKVNLDHLIHPRLFRILASYLDQGISSWQFPVDEDGFLASIRALESDSFSSFFKTRRAKNLLLHTDCDLSELLELLVGEESLYARYLFDQQFAHRGWSGMVSVLENYAGTLQRPRKISLSDLIAFELLLEIDALDHHLGEEWPSLAARIVARPTPLFAPVPDAELTDVLLIWHEAFEWTYYDRVLASLKNQKNESIEPQTKSFQALFCIDNRECSLRRHLEELDPGCETFGTPGHFGIEFYFQPEGLNTFEKVCPPQASPAHLVREVGFGVKKKKDLHFSKHTNLLMTGLLASKTLGYWSALKMTAQMLKPAAIPSATSSFRYMERLSRLTIDNNNPEDREANLQIGFTHLEMADRVENLLRSIGLVHDFAPIIYVVGHGSSSTNNTHFAAFDCAACAGRPGSVNARVFAFMSNHPAVRTILHARGITIPAQSQFVGALHDTTRDEICFYDEQSLSSENQEDHLKNEKIFQKALGHNAKERSRRFDSISATLSIEQVRKKMRQRSVSLFEPLAELGHANNALCVIGRRTLTKNLFLDRRAFLNSYDYRTDPGGRYLSDVLKIAVSLCSGINLDYFFSRVDNEKIGSGSKISHDLSGLLHIGGQINRDLRTGLPGQMTESHDPIRLLFVVEHSPPVILDAIKKSDMLHEIFVNNGVKLASIHPVTRDLKIFKSGDFISYQSDHEASGSAVDWTTMFEPQETTHIYTTH
ncbi:YbcC family protein [Dyadobacter luticola]|uniref:DUF2309 domain-containing protein n=1 Tax=Dyadobacter luticola TaxID=1979387 RepID=A0A5R9KYQ6_9BACT|nr:putative inorganic carbon transporter subunit DabA [Dyadobacter luticola]TLV01288.1 DUF2309 domain-containing protein [Dyadobacter luticola]